MSIGKSPGVRARETCSESQIPAACTARAHASILSRSHTARCTARSFFVRKALCTRRTCLCSLHLCAFVHSLSIAPALYIIITETFRLQRKTFSTFTTSFRAEFSLLAYAFTFVFVILSRHPRKVLHNISTSVEDYFICEYYF